MKNTYLLIVLGIIMSFSGFSQSIKSYAISTAGTSLMNSSGGIYLSLGQALSTEISKGDIMIAQGFLQISIVYNTVSNDNLLEEEILVSPNPSSAFLNLQLKEKDGQYSYEIYSIEGKVMEKNSIDSESTEIDLTQYERGTYFLNVLKEKRKSRTLKIIKI